LYRGRGEQSLCVMTSAPVIRTLDDLRKAPAEVKARLLAGIQDFQRYAERYWKLRPKSGGLVPFQFRPAQRLIHGRFEGQMSSRGFVRLNVLKCRQVGGTTYGRCRGMHFTSTHVGRTGLTIAHEMRLPAEWLARCRELYDLTPEGRKPTLSKSTLNELRFGGIGSRYYIGSAQGGFPGVGDTIHYLHLSELGRWDKPPISVDPAAVLEPLAPAIPSGDDRRGTIIYRESTGVLRGDYWYRCWEAGKRAEDEFENLFLPWFLVPEYRRDDMADSVSALSEYEQDLIKIASGHGVELDHAQIAWRRHEIQQTPYLGNVEVWSSEYPATEDEAFQSPGQAIYTGDMVRRARTTERDPVWKGFILPESNPAFFKLAGVDGGDFWQWEKPDERYHYVLGADCQWGTKNSADFDCLHVQCLETGRLCAKLKGRFNIYEWGRKIAAVGHLYNHCPVAPERGTEAANSMIALLLGNVSDWRYPRVWVRTDDIALKGHRVQDYGWLTNGHTKGDLLQFSQTATMDGTFDWCDRETIDQMASIVRHEDNTIGAPVGSYDDDWMSRIITGYVAHKERGRTELWREPEPVVYHFTDMSERVKAMAAADEEQD